MAYRWLGMFFDGFWVMVDHKGYVDMIHIRMYRYVAMFTCWYVDMLMLPVVSYTLDRRKGRWIMYNIIFKMCASLVDFLLNIINIMFYSTHYTHEQIVYWIHYIHHIYYYLYYLHY